MDASLTPGSCCCVSSESQQCGREAGGRVPCARSTEGELTPETPRPPQHGVEGGGGEGPGGWTRAPAPGSSGSDPDSGGPAMAG